MMMGRGRRATDVDTDGEVARSRTPVRGRQERKDDS